MILYSQQQWLWSVSSYGIYCISEKYVESQLTIRRNILSLS
jgi:hypothetical protein